MTTIDLASIAREAGDNRDRVVLRPISPSKRAERAYRVELNKMIRQMASFVRAEVIPAYQTELQTTRSASRLLEVKGSRRTQSEIDRLRRIGADLSASVHGLTNAIFEAEADRHTERFAASVHAALQVDIDRIIQVEDLRDNLETFAARNSALITNINEELVGRIAQTTLDLFSRGRGVTELRKRLTDVFGFSQKRARTIARNEIGSLTAQLNRERHTQIGVTTYVWMTSRDERVRPLHRAVDGTEHNYDRQCPAEGGGHPGEPINCRCTGRAVVELESEPRDRPARPVRRLR